MGRPKKVLDPVIDTKIEGEKMTENLNSETVTNTPKYGSIEWNDYVMGKFCPGELENGNPNVYGLRRVAEELCGSFVESGPVEVKSSLDGDSIGRAYCVYQIVVYPFMPGADQPCVGDGFEKRIFRACADSYKGNTDDVFALYPTAMAEVRAESRCLRRMLKIKAVSSEELSGKSGAEMIAKEENQKVASTFENDDLISTSQTFVIKRKCEDLKIDMMKLVNSGKEKYTSIEEVTKQTAALIIQRLSQYQTSSVPVPLELVEA